MNRPVILVDLDNVVYDFVQAFADMLVKRGAVGFASTSKSLMQKYRSWNIWEDWDIPKGEFMRYWRLGIEQGDIYANGPLIPGAREALWQLSDAEWDIQVVTNRLSKFGLHDTIAANTVHWLHENNIPYRGLHLTANKRIPAEAIVDDRLDNMSEYQEKHFHFPAQHHLKRNVSPQEQIEYWQRLVTELTVG